jgi:hypothetical protein
MENIISVAENVGTSPPLGEVEEGITMEERVRNQYCQWRGEEWKQYEYYYLPCDVPLPE